MNTVLITGAGGYIGTVLVDECVKAGFNVIAVDRYFFGNERLSEHSDSDQVRLVRKDIRDMTEDDFEGVDTVYDLAALSNDPCGDLNPGLTADINYLGRVNVAQSAKKAGVARYVLASSCSVYGDGKDAVLTEKSDVNPLTSYAKANYDAEQGILPLASEDFTVSVLRQSTVFGLSPRMRFDLVINIMTLNATEKGKIFVTGGGQQYRPLIHVRDTARAFIALSQADKSLVNKEVFNVGHSNLKVVNIAYVVRETVPFPIDLSVVPDDADKRNYLVSFDKIRDTIGFEPIYSPTDGVKEIYEALKSGDLQSNPWNYTVAWYKRILEAQQLIKDIELNGRLI